MFFAADPVTSAKCSRVQSTRRRRQPDDHSDHNNKRPHTSPRPEPDIIEQRISGAAAGAASYCRPSIVIISGVLLFTLFTQQSQCSLSPPDSHGGCKQVYFGQRHENNIACQCDANHCDSLDFAWPREDDKFVQVRSTKAGARFQVQELAFERLRRAADLSEHIDYVVDIQVNNRRQQVVGFGGAVTDAAAQNIMGLPEQVRRHAFEDYYGARGLDYNMARVPCGGTDMSDRVYTYDDLPAGREDFELRHFKLQREDLELKIPFLQRVNAMRAARGLGQVKVMSTSWSPPVWMKNNSYISQGYLKGDHNGPYYDAYARYLLRFMDEYERHNVSFWAIAGQNEPYTTRRVGISFNSCNFQPNQLADFNEFNLIPALERANRTSDKLLLFLFDDNLNGHEPFTEELLSRPKIMQFARGLARHWYIKDDLPYVELSIARLQYPYHYVGASTEASFISRPSPGNWQRGELYALDIMENLLAGFGVWIDWNLALDMGGGPTWVGNYLDAAMLVEPHREVYYKNPMYYALGHISRFIRRGSRLISTGVFPVSWLNGTARVSEQVNLSRNVDRREQPVSVVAAELAPADEELVGARGRDFGETLRRRFALVALNRAPKAKRLELRLAQCRAIQSQAGRQSGQVAATSRPLVLELPANSITSLAFNC